MNALANGVPDISFRSSFTIWFIIGSGRSGITEHTLNLPGLDLNPKFFGRYSHTNRYVSYYGDNGRKAQITWKCGADHMKITGRREGGDFGHQYEIEFNPEFNAPGMYNIATDFTMGELLYTIATRGNLFSRQLSGYLRITIKITSKMTYFSQTV